MVTTACFSSELFVFLRDLKRHNRRDWFNANKNRYETVVRAPALQFIVAFAAPLRRISPHIVADPHPTRGSLFRIYRDTRFSADKKPYKTHVGIHFWHEAKKEVHAPGYYLHLEPEGCFAAAGIWHPDAPTLTRIRTAIVRNSAEWAKVRRKLNIEGDTLSRPPRGFPPDHPFMDDLKRKDYLASVSFSDTNVCSAGFLKQFAEACRTMRPLLEFTSSALGLPF